MKAMYFEGEKGITVVEKEIPEEWKAEAETWHKKMIERVAGEETG